MAAKVREHGVNVELMQLAALLIERTTEELSEEEAEDLVRPSGAPADDRPFSDRVSGPTTRTRF